MDNSVQQFNLLGDNGLLNADIDFDLSDFDIVTGDISGAFLAEPQEHILKPRICKEDIPARLSTKTPRRSLNNWTWPRVPGHMHGLTAILYLAT